MAKLYVEGLTEAITVDDAPDFEEACAMISELKDLDLVVFPAADSDCAVLKRRLIMFVQSKEKLEERIRQYVIPTKATDMVLKKKTRKKRARSTSVQKRDSQ